MELMALIRHHCTRRVAFTPAYVMGMTGASEAEVKAGIEQAVAWKWCYPSVSSASTREEKADPFRKAKGGQTFYIGRLT